MSWTTRIEGGPKRVNHAAVACGHKIYSFGGYCTGESLRDYTSIDVHVLNTVSNRWIEHPVSDYPYMENDDILPFKRYGHTAVIYGDKIYIWGGRNYRTSCAVLFCFDTFYNCWSAPHTTGEIPSARDGHTAVIWKHYMYIFGGYEEASNSFARSIPVLDLHTMNWTTLVTHGEKAFSRDFHSAVCLDNKMYIFGGRGMRLQVNANTDMDYSQEVYSNTLWYLDLYTNEWHTARTTGEAPTGRRSHSAFVYNDKMYIFGGFNSILGKHYNDLHEYDPTTSTWKEITTLGEPPCERRRQAAVMVEDKLFVFGGTSPIPGSIAHPYNYTYIYSYNNNDENNDDNDENNVVMTINDEDDNLMDHSDLYILDFKPTLKTLCISAVLRYKLKYSKLPRTLKRDVKYMKKPNNITVIRPLCSAG